ncbi:SDR family NAD(P)-dependent oxidoreductase [Paenibacillus flagellatus]|uniref:Short-chain dehydrogenase n=1 Tax=Paenibacillus flagellatus TaxID=2211139 RepID=A0A2V5L3W7_9BACL|nr:SDR family NAD(P)-dependent oxidoreductase [Paenibacillus flagellatus]PYI57536.1 short-chain dehydrogenase [Paenibacillus flagellatus]
MLQGKTILITGAAGMLGRSAVPMFLEYGANVVGCDIVPLDRSPELQGALERYGDGRFLFLTADATDEEQVRMVVDAADAKFGRLDGTYHNVYTNIWKPALELSLDEWERTMRGTLTSTFLVCKHALPLLIRSGGGAIVNTSSVLGHLPKKGCLGYGAGKAGVNQLTRVIATDYADRGVRANVLVPGDFKSPERLDSLPESHQEMMRRETALGRSGSSDEVNRVAAFLLSDLASYITGSLYSVDGGYHL